MKGMGRTGVTSPSIDRSVPYILWFAIGVMLLPFVLVFELGVSGRSLEVLVTIAWISQMVALVSLLMGRRVPVLREGLVLAGLFVVFQSLTALSVLLSDRELDTRDFVSLVARAITMLIILAVFPMIRVRMERLAVFLGGFLVFALLACLYNLIANWGMLTMITSVASTYQLEFRSFFPNRNQFGAVLFLSLVAHALLVVIRRRGLRLWNVLAIVAQFVSLVLTFSRGALLAALVFALVLLVPRVARTAWRTFFLIAASATIIGFVAANYSLVAEVLLYILRPEVGASGRVEIWRTGLTIWGDHNVLLGTGLFTGIQAASSEGFAFDQFHSLYIDTLVDGGILQLVLLSMVFGLVVGRLGRSRCDSDVKRIWIAAFAGFLVLGAVESVSVFSIGFVDSLYTVFFVGLPLLLANVVKLPSFEGEPAVRPEAFPTSPFPLLPLHHREALHAASSSEATIAGR